MVQGLHQLEEALRAVIESCSRSDISASLASLRKAEPGLDPELVASTTRVVDLASQVIQLLEPAHLVLADHFFAYQNTQCLAATVCLNIPDHLAAGPQPIDALATMAKARPDRLRQIMRLLCNNGVFHYDLQTNLFQNNEASEMLRRDHWAQWHLWPEVCSSDFYEMARGLPQALAQGTLRSSAQIHYDTDESMFSYLERNGTMLRLRNCMGAAAIAQTPGMISGYPWGELLGTSLMDLGGGDGSLMAALLRAFPDLQGGVFDMPRVLPHLQEAFHSPAGKHVDVGARISPERLVAGNFLQEVVPSSAYVMRWCLHDWDDDHAVRVLKNIRRAIVPGPVSRLVLLELVLTDGRMGRMSRLGDINVMITAEQGQERTEQEWTALAARSGWKVVGITPLPGAWPSAIDLRPIDVAGLT